MRRLNSVLGILLLCFLLPSVAQAGTLDTVKARGKLVCGVNGDLPGFSNLNADGSWTGIDADYCRAVAAAVLGDAHAVEFIPLSAAQRFVALQTGEIDLLNSVATWTLTRDAELGLTFAPTTFYDGQGFMVRKDLGVTTLDELSGATICTPAGTTSELNLADSMRARGIPFTPVVFESYDTLYNSYEQGRCDAVTSDKSQLASRRSVMANPDDHIVLEATISKEPLGPVIAQGDDQWQDVVTWTVFATFFAEEHGITAENIDSFADTQNPEIARFLGASGDMGRGLGLDTKWAINVIKGVGNYGEIFDRNLVPLGLPRGENRPYTDGGLQYAMPFR